MSRKYATLLLAFLVTTIAACSGDESGGQGSAAGGGSGGGDERVAKIPVLPGYKYYVGGPVMKRDAWGQYRLTHFQGEVEAPPSRGMIFGAKAEGNQLEYRVWANGRLLAFHRGTMKDGLFWQDYAESYRDEKLVARERDEHIDADARTKLVTEDIDPETGEVIRVKEAMRSYKPPKIVMDEDEEAEDDDQGDEAEPAGEGRPASPAGAAPPEGAGKP